MTTLKPVRLNHLKTQASFLLKELHNTRELTTVLRLTHLPAFAGKNHNEILANINAVKLKHAFEVIAFENGFNSWTSLKNFVVEQDCLYRSSHVGLIHAWFSDYPKAEDYFLKHGGYLLAFWKDFVVCGDEYINHLDLLVYKDHWKHMDFNWVKPANYQSWKFLNGKASENYIKLT